MKKRHIVLSLLITVSCCTMFAQKRKTIKPKKPKVQPVVLTPSEILYQSMLGATAKLMFVDSVVVDKADFLTQIPLNSEAGKLASYSTFFKTEKGKEGAVYINEFQNIIYFSEGDTLGAPGIYTSDRLGNGWSSAQQLSEIDTVYHEQNYPFLMADGITLLFAAKGKNSLGGYDIFMTRKNTETGKFYEPENYGLPFNSTANDYLLAFDEPDNLGWLVSDRFQPEGKVCIYTFVPTTQRVPFKEGEVTQKQLEAYARLESIAQTWKFGNRTQALNTIKAMLQGKGKGTSTASIHFPINDNTVYRSVSDFKTKRGKSLYLQLVELREMLKKTEEKLDAKRENYHRGKREESIDIIALEKEVQQVRTECQTLKKLIRNSENGK